MGERPIACAAAARTLGVKENTGMSGRSCPDGAYRGSTRVQSAPGEPLGWCPGAGMPPVPAAGGNGALENLRSIISASKLPLAISALVAAVGTMGMVHPVLLTQMLVVACGVPPALQLLKNESRVLPACIFRKISGIPTTSASEYHEFPPFPWDDRGSSHGAAPAVTATGREGASPSGAGPAGTTGENSSRGGSRTTAKGQLCAVPRKGEETILPTILLTIPN